MEKPSILRVWRQLLGIVNVHSNHRIIADGSDRSDGCGAQISNEPWVAQKVLAGVQTLNEYLAKGYSIYGKVQRKT